MSHRLQQQIEAIGRRARRLWLLYGLGWLLAGGLGSAFILLLLDYWLRFEDRGLRVMATGMLLTVWALASYRFLWRPWRARLTPINVAQRLEKRFPVLADRLASSIGFLSQPEDDPRSGSAQLRRAVIHETATAVDALDLNEALDARRTKRALAVGLSLVAIAFVFALVRPELARVGVRRLALPFGADLWPQHTHLGFRERVDRVAVGQPFEAQVIDAQGAKLPAEIWIEYRQARPDGSFAVERQSLTASGDVAIAHRDRVTRPFAYRASGGDDNSMPWNEVQVLEPPVIDDLSLTLHYPAHTGWPNAPSERHIRALEGTKVAIAGRATKAIRAARVVADGESIPLVIGADGRSFSLAADAEKPFVVAKSGGYLVELEDAQGLVGGRDARYELRAVADLEPTVSIDAPAANTFATPNAVVPLKITVSDDLAIKAIELVYLRSDKSQAGEQREIVYHGPEAPPTVENKQAVETAPVDRGERRQVEERWELAALGLAPGSELTLHAEASDYRPAIGRSTPRHISIVAPHELEQRLEERHGKLLAELTRVLKLQQSSRAQVSATTIQAQQVGRFEAADLDRLQAAATGQRQVDRALTNREEGLRSQVAGILADIENNQLDNPEIKRRTQAVADEIAGLERERLPRIDRALTAAEKSARLAHERPESNGEVLAKLKEAGREQDQVIMTLERLLGELSQWDNQRRIVGELNELAQDQRRLFDRANELGRKTVSKDLAQLAAQEQADLQKLAAEQHELARRLDAAQQNMQRAKERLEADEPLTAQAIDDALARGQADATSGTMREAGAGIEENQIGQATVAQQQAEESLREMLDIMSNRREHELARLVKKLREAEQELAQLRDEQAKLQKKMDAAAKLPQAERQRELERLARRQRELEEQAARMSRKLQRLDAQRSSNSLASAGEKMGAAGQQGEQGAGEQAADSSAQAKSDLDQAQAELAQRRREAEQDLALEQLAKMEQALESLRDRQQAALGETARLEGLRQSSGQLTRAQAQSVLVAAQNQSDLATESLALAKRLSAAEAFALALDGASREMSSAAALLRKQDTGATTSGRQQLAVRRLEQLLAALSPDSSEDSAQSQGAGGGGAGGGAGAGGQGEQIADVAQLKLLRLMQEELNERTLALARTGAAPERLTPAQREEFAWLGEQQGKLADVVRNLAQPEAEAEDTGEMPGEPGQDEPSEPRPEGR